MNLDNMNLEKDLRDKTRGPHKKISKWLWYDKTNIIEMSYKLIINPVDRGIIRKYFLKEPSLVGTQKIK